MAKPGLDGHDVGVKVLAQGLKEAGYDVVYTGLRKSIETIAEMAQTHRADAIGLSILSGTHLILAERMREVLEEKNLRIPWFVGGNIPAFDVPGLEAIGAAKAFPTGTKVADVVAYLAASGLGKL